MAAWWATEDFEAGSNGASVTSGNSFFAALSGTPVFSNAQALNGALSMLIGTTASRYGVSPTFTATQVGFVRFFLYIGTWGGNSVVLSQMRSTSTPRCEIQLIDSSGSPRLRLRNASTQVFTPTVNLPTGAWVRVDWQQDGGGNGQRCWWYTGANLFSTNTADASQDTGWRTFNTGTFNNMTLGQVNSVAATNSFYFDWVGGDSAAMPALPSTLFDVGADDVAGLTDSISIYYEPGVTDDSGLTDSTAFSVAATYEDLGGLTDFTIAEVTKQVPDDDTGLTDSVTVSIFGGIQDQFPEDDAGISDFQVFEVQKALTDVAGVTDSTAAEVQKIIPDDDSGLTDSTTVQLSAGGTTPQNPQDDSGLTDAGGVVDVEGFLTEDSGLTDSVTIQVIPTTMIVLNFTDDVGLSEHGAGFVTFGIEVTDSVGLVDQAFPGKTVTEVTDGVGLTDAVTLDLTLGSGVLIDITPTDAFFLTDDVTIDLQAFTAEGLVRLVLNLGFEAYPRPNRRLWKRFHYPRTQVGLLLWRTGRVEVVTDFAIPDFLTADVAVPNAGGYVIPSDSWQAEVLRNAGYTLEVVR